jgi:hypothetical protein
MFARVEVVRKSGFEGAPVYFLHWIAPAAGKNHTNFL